MTDKRSAVWKPKLTPAQRAEVDALDNELGERIFALQALRKAMGLTQADLAILLKTTQSNVSKLEGGRKVPVEVYRKLVESKGGTLEVVARIGGKALVLPL